MDRCSQLWLSTLFFSFLLSTIRSEEPVSRHYAVDVTSKNLASTVNSEGYTLIEFYASWCPACRNFAPEYERVCHFLYTQPVKDHKLGTYRVDCAIETSLCDAFTIRAYPTVMFGASKAVLDKNPQGLIVYPANKKEDLTAANIVTWVGGSDHGVALPAQGGPSAVSMDLKDVEGATVQLFHLITSSQQLHSGEDKRTAVVRWARLVTLAHPVQRCRAGAQSLLARLPALWPEGAEQASEAFRSTRVCGDGEVYKDEDWVACRGSKPGARGFTCGLWLLFHSLAAGLPENGGHLLMHALRDFNEHFFQCEICRTHFMKVLATSRARGVTSQRDVVIWLWEAHNEVNARLAEVEHKYGHSSSGDPLVVKVQWPPSSLCALCKVGDKPWNTTEVYHFLMRHYHVGPPAVSSSGSIIKEAGSQALPGVAHLDLNFNSWMLMGGMVVAVLYLLWSKKRHKRTPRIL